jgi:hypothetical protein
MPYDEILARRIREALLGTPEIVEKKMFGGIGYLLNGNMACGVNGDALIVRVGPEAYESALAEPHTRVFDMTGRPMTGWVVVEADGIASDKALQGWVDRGLAFARILPAK